MTALMEMPVARKSLRGNPLPLMRGARVKRLAARAKTAVLSALRRMNAEAVDRVKSGKPPLAIDALDRWSKWWVEAQRGVMGYVALEGAKQARAELGMTKSVLVATATDDGDDKEDATEAWKKPRKPDPMDPESPIYLGHDADSFLNASYQQPVDEWLRKVASASTKAHAGKIERIHKEAQAYWDEEKQQGMTPAQMAKRIREEMPEYTESRARMIAYTNTNWAFNSGIRTEYAKMGVTVLEWMTSEDDSVCPWCRAMDGARVKIDDPFWRAGDEFGVEVDGKEGEKQVRTMKLPYAIDHPPLHPNCSCVLIPVLVGTGTIGSQNIGRDGEPLGQSHVSKNRDVDTSDLPLARGANWKELDKEVWREMLLERAADGEKIEVVPKLDKLKEYATDSAFKLRSERTVFFGLEGEQFQKMEQGDILRSMGARSTTESMRRAESYVGSTGQLFEVVVPKGSRAINAKVLGERETVLLPGSQFRVIGRSKGRVILEMQEDGAEYILELSEFQKVLDKVTKTGVIPEGAAKVPDRYPPGLTKARQ